MTIDEKVKKTLGELGVSDAAGVETLFAELRAAMEQERAGLISRGASNETERDKLCKDLRDRWLARKNGLLSFVDEKWLKASAKELKPSVGKSFNGLRQESEAIEIAALTKVVPFKVSATFGIQAESLQHISAKHEVPAESLRRLSAPVVIQQENLSDLTLPGNRRAFGSLHPVTRMQREIEEIFLSLGFRIESGPEIESVYYNFDALNILESHPSRDDWDTLYIDSKTLLRTHTSPVQIRSMEKYGAPLHIIIPGKCYRHDNPDASHSPMFHQIEGLAIGSDITFADLKGTLDFFAKKLFGEKIRTRFQPSFFPFTEPSGEVSISCIFCGGDGCRVCKESGWIEVMGCGMVHPQVLRNGGVDPEKYSGWAFGLGVDRFAMMKYDINDIQLFFQSDIRFLQQF
jgi:phenylalanyl-tRNA synthetase alpha chain